MAAGGTHSAAPLNYATSVARPPQSRLGVASCLIFLFLCGWFAWGAVRILQAFYAGPGIPGASWMWWSQAVPAVGSVVAVTGMVVGILGVRNPGRSSVAAVIGAFGNTVALATYAVMLLSTL